ncbi:Bud site selection protein 6 [Paramarasmius palmivorus]|uniref:Bud site selection protein 6 n=1 Tax=Paramarasmius palmivorus TaxID=297713 RepID=A0AAW0BCE6_9AGAR
MQKTTQKTLVGPEAIAEDLQRRAIESSVTLFLVSIKQLLQALTEWSHRKVDESHVSDVYVESINHFHASVMAFAVLDIDTSDLESVPDDLRNVLEECLSENPSVPALMLYLPTVKGIITNVLELLRRKQKLYRRRR